MTSFFNTTQSLSITYFFSNQEFIYFHHWFLSLIYMEVENILNVIMYFEDHKKRLWWIPLVLTGYTPLNSIPRNSLSRLTYVFLQTANILWLAIFWLVNLLTLMQKFLKSFKHKAELTIFNTALKLSKLEK